MTSRGGRHVRPDDIERFEAEGGPPREEDAAAGHVSVGAAFGQGQIGIAVLQDEGPPDSAGSGDESQRPGVERHYTARRLERLPAAPGEEIIDALCTVLAEVGPLETRPDIYIDVADGGSDLLGALEARHLPARVWSVAVTFGDEYEVNDREVRAGKQALLSRLYILLRDGQLHLPPDPRFVELKDLLPQPEDLRLENDPVVKAIALALHGLPRRPWGPL
ncbi:MAG TPA: hypothetical protein VFB90_00355 [Dehalococcoidia bacterium]|nr:hypothetical protein [Dehalococcoidia bacterium]